MPALTTGPLVTSTFLVTEMRSLATQPPVTSTVHVTEMPSLTTRPPVTSTVHVTEMPNLTTRPSVTFHPGYELHNTWVISLNAYCSTILHAEE